MAVSTWVTAGASGELNYRTTSTGDRIADFSAVGYRAGREAIPSNVPVQAVVAPQEGDDGAAIQAAIDAVAQLPLDEQGFRGVVELTAGEFQIEGQLHLGTSGVVLRGAGDDEGETVLRATGTDPRSLVLIAGTGTRQAIAPTTSSVTSKYVPVGARSFRVSSTAGLKVGDSIIVHRPSTQAWIKAIGMDLLTNPWQPGTKDLLFDRVITRIEGDWLTVDAPITTALDAKYGGATVYAYTWDTRIENVGLEQIRGVSDFVIDTDENHAWTFVEIQAAQNVWVRDITAQHFVFAAVNVLDQAKWVTVADAQYLDPKSQLIGGRRYAFNVEGQQVLVKDSYSLEARHDYALGSLSAGPNVYVDSWAESSYNDTGPHHRWATGTLFDNIQIPNHQINLRNRGNSGTGHGWAGANSVIWNSTAKSFIVESPPTAYNWLIGSTGAIASNSMAVGSKPPGIRESHGIPVTPRSLYYAQLEASARAANLEEREYWVGDIDQFKYASVDESISVWTDPAWLTEVRAAAGGKVMSLDKTSKNTWAPLSFQFSLAPGERVVSASLSLGLRATQSDVSKNRVYFDSLQVSQSVAQLGWGRIPQSGTTPRQIDLASYLPALQDGQFNLALKNDLAVDWAMLRIDVAPAPEATPQMASALYDAEVRGGLDAGTNFGQAIWLGAQASSTAPRESYFAFDISGFQGNVVQALVRLPIATASPLTANSAALVAGSWDESTITWNNKPASSGRLATWRGVPGGWASIDVTAAVASLRASGSDQISLRVYASSGSGLLTYESREAEASRQPVLEVYFA